MDAEVKPEDVAEAVLKQFDFNSQIVLPQSVVGNLKVSAEFNAAIHSWALKLKGWVWSEDLGENECVVRVQTPASTWDYFKAQYFKGKIFSRLLSLMPIKLKMHAVKVKVHHTALYPKLSLVVPDGQSIETFIIKSTAEDIIIQ